MKKIFSFAVSIMLFACMLCAVEFNAFAVVKTEDVEKTQLGTTDTYYSFDAQTKTLTISGNGATPDFKNDNASQPWYQWRGHDSIEHVVVEEGITAIGDYFFINVGASDFKLPSTLISIGNSAMSNANYVKSITLPEGLTTIENNAFRYSIALESVNIPSTVTKIGLYAFEYCSTLNNVIFDDLYSQMTIGKRAFFGCSSLKNVTIPKRATLSAYSFGFYSESKGSVYSGFVMNIYRDSPSYTYASNYIKSADNYNILNEFNITENQSIVCEYFADSYKDDMIFSFTPTVSDKYKFFSAGDVDVDCDFDGNLYSDNSLDDLNFIVSSYLEAGETYYFTVKCVSQMSLGEFSVTLIQEHSYDCVITPPTLTDEGYTKYTCEYCGDSYLTDYVSRTGIKVSGRVVLMEAPDGSHPHDFPVVYANLAVDGSAVDFTDRDGKFEFYIDSNAKELTIYSDFAAERKFAIISDENMEMKLGDIALFHFDYNKDSYVNAKDFAVVRSLYGSYSQNDNEIFVMLDYNQDSIIDYEDFKYAKSFFTYGKITESIYDY